MINISHYTSTSAIKPELLHVKVYREAGHLVTVATDSYRLARICYDLKENMLLDNIEDGYYLAHAFKTLCKELAKKKEYGKADSIKAFNDTGKSLLFYQYPDYMQLVKDIEKDQERAPGLCGEYRADYLADHVELCAELAAHKYNGINTSDMSSREKRPLVYQKEKSYILLMPLIK